MVRKAMPIIEIKLIIISNRYLDFKCEGFILTLNYVAYITNLCLLFQLKFNLMDYTSNRYTSHIGINISKDRVKSCEIMVQAVIFNNNPDRKDPMDSVMLIGKSLNRHTS